MVHTTWAISTFPLPLPFLNAVSLSDLPKLSLLSLPQVDDDDDELVNGDSDDVVSLPAVLGLDSQGLIVARDRAIQPLLAKPANKFPVQSGASSTRLKRHYRSGDEETRGGLGTKTTGKRVPARRLLSKEK